MKTTILCGLLTLSVTTSAYAGFGDLLNQAKEITSAASDAGKLISDPTGSKARQEKKDREEQERQDRLAREDKNRQDKIKRQEQARKDRIAREERQAIKEKQAREERLSREERDRKAREEKQEKYAQAEKERKEQAMISEEKRLQRIAQQQKANAEYTAKQKQIEKEKKQKISTLIQQDRAKALDQCEDWSGIKGDFIGQKNSYPMNLIMCRAEINNKSARRPVELDKTFGVITMANLKLKQNKHGDWLVEEVTDTKPEERYNNQQRDFAADILISTIVGNEYEAAEGKL